MLFYINVMLMLKLNYHLSSVIIYLHFWYFIEVFTVVSYCWINHLSRSINLALHIVTQQLLYTNRSNIRLCSYGTMMPLLFIIEDPSILTIYWVFYSPLHSYIAFCLARFAIITCKIKLEHYQVLLSLIFPLAIKE